MDIASTTKLTGIPVSVIKTQGLKLQNSWLMRRLLDGPLKRKVRAMLALYSSWRMRALVKENGTSSKDLWSAGKSVETVQGIDSATAIMRSLGESLTHRSTFEERS
jgi:hypothetical protein